MEKIPRKLCDASQNPAINLRALLGDDVVLLAWRKGIKGTKKQWGHLTAAHMTPAYVSDLERGNIGVVTGKKSGNLVALDVDDETLVQPFLDLNPFLKDTLQTHGARGRVFWFRCLGDYPSKTMKLKGRSGEDYGEFRSNKSQSIIHGIHPSGKAYEIVHHAKPATVAFVSIVWPEQISNPPTTVVPPALDGLVMQPDRATETVTGGSPAQMIQSYRATELHSYTATQASALYPSSGAVCLNVEQAVQMSLPKRVHENNNCLFMLARAVKALEIQSEEFNAAQLRDVFDQWFKRGAKFMRPEQSCDDYFVQFLNAYASAKTPLGEGVASRAWKLAQERPLPPEAITAFADPKMRLVVALCRELQIVAGEGPFFLAARTLQRLLKHDIHIAAARWLKAICALKLLAVAEPGTKARAARYRYLGAIPPNTATQAGGTVGAIPLLAAPLASDRDEA